MRLIFLIAFIAFYMSGNAVSQSDTSANSHAFDIGISYIGDVLSNTSGGIETGTWYLGLVNLRMALHTGAANMWKGGVLFVNIANTHGETPSNNFIGDYQIVSNIEAGNHMYMQELWYRQNLGIVEITAGLQDLNIDYANTSNGSFFLNSSFGMLSTVSSNVPAPVFPMTSLGVSTKWFLSKKSTFLFAVFDGNPTDFDENPNNLNWSLSGDDGILAFAEYQFASQISGLPGTYKAGLYMHQHFNKSDAANADSLYNNNNGFYMIADQVIWNSTFRKRSLSVFSQLGLSPKHMNINQYYVSAGLRYTGLFDVQGNDALGFAFNRVGLRGPVQDETALELTCRIPVMKFLFIQADIQYVIHPAGTGKTIDNALVTILRFGINF